MIAWKIILTPEQAKDIAQRQLKRLSGDLNIRRQAIYIQHVEKLQSPICGEDLLNLKLFATKRDAKNYLNDLCCGIGKIEKISLPGVGKSKVAFGRVHV